MRKANARQWGLPVALGLAALCSGASGCGDTDERPATWSYISAAIIQPNCGTSRCHAKGSETGPTFPGTPPYRMLLDTVDDGYATLAEPFPTINDTKMTEPLAANGDPDTSILVQRLTGKTLTYVNSNGVERVLEGARMPPDDPLPEADIELIRKWVAAGAPKN